MQTVGFPISHKENEKRRALLPNSIQEISHPKCLFIEQGYGDVLGISDDEYSAYGVNIVSRDIVLSQNVICDPKIGDADYLEQLERQTIFGWIHAVQNRDITDKIIEKHLTAFAWEEMFEDGRHVFWRNNELAGEAAVLHAYQCFGKLPYETRVAVIGRGNTARGAIKALNMLGANVQQYDRRMEKLLRKELGMYDVVVNCVLWDTSRKDHIICHTDLMKMKRNAMIIDVSCDRHGGIETSVPTTIEHPVYQVDGVLHYVVDHSPAIFYKTFTENNSRIITPFLNEMIEGKIGDVLIKSCIIQNGCVLDQRINEFQNRN